MSEQTTQGTTPPAETPPTTTAAKIVLALQAVGIGVLIAIVVSLARLAQHPEFQAFYLGLDQMRTPLIAGGLALVVVIASLIWIRPKSRTVLTAAAVLFVMFLGLKSVLRIESFSGGMVPRFAWRWTPTAEEQFAEFQSQHAAEAAETAEVASGIDVVARANDYTTFLGTARDGVINNIALETDWSAYPPRELWRHPVGLGWGGFSVSGDAAITQEQRGEEEAVVCYDLKTGREEWVSSNTQRFVDTHGDGPRANPTIVDGRVYTMGALGQLSCINGANGAAIWTQNALADPASQNILWGMSGSPLVVENRVIVTPGGGAGRAIVAYDAAQGDELFHGGDDPAGYASPALVQLAGQTQFLSFNGAGLRGFDEQGQPLWLHPWLTQGESQRVNVAQPIVVEGLGEDAANVGHVLVSSGYGTGAALLRITHENDQWQVTEVWRNRNLKSKMSNFVVHGGFVYGMDNGIMTCLDVRTGDRQWKKGRYGHGQILLVGDVLLVQSESGEVVLVEATPEEHHKLATLSALGDKTWNHPTLSGNILIVRNDREAAAFELPLRQANDVAVNSTPQP